MADVSIFNLPAMAAAVAPTDVIPFTDVSDHTESPQGTSKKMLVSQLLAVPGLTLTAPVVITGVAAQLTLNADPAPQVPRLQATQAGVFFGGLQWPAPSTLQFLDNGGAQVALLTGGSLALGEVVVTTNPTGAQGSLSYNASYGLVLRAKTGTINDFSIVNAAFSLALLGNPTGTNNLEAAGLFTAFGGVIGAGAPGLTTRGTPGGAYAALWILNGTGGVAQLNWEIGKSVTVANALQFTPSTANDGTAFAAPAATLTPTGTLSITGPINAIGLSSFTGDVATGNAAYFASASAGVAPIVRWIRSAATARTWQLRLNVAGGFEFVDESAGALRAEITAGGLFIHYQGVNILAGGLSVAGQITTTQSLQAAHVIVSDPTPYYVITDPTAGVNSRNILMLGIGGQFSLSVYDDTLSTSAPFLQAFRSGTTVTGVVLSSGGAARLTVDSVGVIFIGATTTALGAATGEIVLPNGRSIKGANAANTNTIPLAASDAFDHVILGGGATLVRIGQAIAAALPAGSVNNTGGLMLDATNNRLCYWINGVRFFLAGTAF